MSASPIALIVGAGAGLSAAFARRAAAAGYRVALAARNTDKLVPLAQSIDARCYGCDVVEPTEVIDLFANVEADFGVPEVVLFNPSARAQGPVTDIDPAAVRQALLVTAFGGFLVGQAAARAMLPQGSGSILFTGASASVKGFANSSPFAMGKFGLRGLAQSMARELAPQGIHVAHFVIDGGIRKADGSRQDAGDDRFLDPEAIAETYWAIHCQPRSAWTWEVELRPWQENF